MKKLASVLIAAISICHAFAVAAQSLQDQATPFITNYKRTEIFDSQYWSAVQDYRGIMYFGINTGIVEFDGIEYKFIKTPLNYVIRSLCMAPDSVIYAGGANDFGYLAFTRTGETVFKSLLHKLEPEHRNFNAVTKILHAENATWFLTENSGVFKLQNDSITVLPIHLLSRFGAVAHNKLFLFQPDKGIAVVHNDKPVFLPHTLPFTQRSVGKIELLPFGENKLLIVTKNNGLYIYHYDQLPKSNDYAAQTVPPSIVTKFETEVDDYLVQNIVYPCLRVGDQYVFGTLLGGIVVVDEQGKLVKIITENHGLDDNIIYGLYADRNQNLWALTNNGVSCVEINSSITAFNNDEKLSKYLSYATKHHGLLYVTHDRGIAYLREEALKSRDKRDLFSPVQGIIGRVEEFCRYRDIILCEADNQLYAIYQGQAKKIGEIGTVYDIIPSSKFPNTFFYSAESVGLGYFQIDYQSRAGFPDIQLTNHKNVPNLSRGLSVAEDPQGNILLSARMAGLYHIKFNNSLEDYRIVQYDTTHGLPTADLANFIVYDDHLFVTSPNGLFEATTMPTGSACCDSISGFVPERYFKENLKGHHTTVSNGSVLDGGELWLNTDKGAMLLLKDDANKPVWKNIPLGISPGAVSKDSDGVYWITFNSRLYRYDMRIKDLQKPFHVMIRNISIGDSVIFNGAYFNPAAEENAHFLSATLTQPEELVATFRFNNSSIAFECAASSYDAVGSNTYSYFLEGLDKTWSEWSSKPKREYSYLPPGKYTFKVRARNVRGEQSAGEASYSFEIVPPWYQSMLAYIGYFVFGILVISGGVRLYYNRLIQSKTRLEKIVEKRTTEIREKNIQLSDTLHQLQELHNFKESMIHMIVHDLKNPLNTIIGFSYGRQTEKTNSFVLHSGKTMLNMVENILNVHKFEESKIKLNIETADIKEVIGSALEEVSFIASERKIRLTDNTSTCSFLFDVELIKRVLVNLLSNAIKFSPGQDEVIVGTEMLQDEQGTFIRISVEDNGTGIPPGMTDKIFDKYVQVEARKLGIAHSTGLGLTFCKIVVEAHRGKIGVQPKAEKGSVFYFTLPVISE